MEPISTQEAIELMHTRGTDIHQLLSRANMVRMQTRPHTINLCGIANAKSGRCPENCKFCAQSVHNDTQVECYDLLNAETLAERAQTAQDNQANRFGIVTSGLKIEKEDEISELEKALSTICSSKKISPCASLGKLDKDTLSRLKKAGLTRYHCNLETAQSFYSQICTTRDWNEAVKTIIAAKEVGLATCCGGLFGLGESLEQRVELLKNISDLDVDSVPLNFFNPVKGTQIEPDPDLTPLECLKIIAIARLMLPTKEIRVCGGREYALKELQSWSLISGADGLMVGGYLTTTGRKVEDDINMISQTGFEIEKSH